MTEICFRSPRHWDRQLYRKGDGDQTATECQLDDSEGEVEVCVKAVCLNLQQVTEQVQWDAVSCWTLCWCLPSLKVKYMCGERRAWKGSLTHCLKWPCHTVTKLQRKSNFRKVDLSKVSDNVQQYERYFVHEMEKVSGSQHYSYSHGNWK